MAILARLSLSLPAVGTSQPLPEGIVNNRIPKNSKMAWGAELAALLKLGICVLARGDVVQRPGKELMPLERPPEFVGKHSGSFVKREPCGGIETDIPDFVAEVAGDAFGFDSRTEKGSVLSGALIAAAGTWQAAQSPVWSGLSSLYPGP